MPQNASLAALEKQIRRRLDLHLHRIGYILTETGELEPPDGSKETIRALHHVQREDRLRQEQAFIQKQWPKLKQYFADGCDVDPSKINAGIELIRADTWQSDLFRLASLTWSVPVSPGYGRRMRFLVWDKSNGKLMGLIGLCDPVFNLQVRDIFIKWSAQERQKRLVHVLSAYVLGSIPPYNQLLTGKLVACLVRTKQIKDTFAKRYVHTRGVISRERKNASLVLVTISSAFGRSSLYNRLKLNNQQYFKSIGYTGGWGHFHIPDDLFVMMRQYLTKKEDKYAKNHRFGDGPNWRLRAVRHTLNLLGLNPTILRHGVTREVFVCELATNAIGFLSGKFVKPCYRGLLTISQVSELARQRWIEPRAKRFPEYKLWKKEQLLASIDPQDPNMD